MHTHTLSERERERERERETEREREMERERETGENYVWVHPKGSTRGMVIWERSNLTA